MKKINGPCELCVALAACRHKEWYQIITSCSKVRVSIVNFATDYVHKKSIPVKITPLGKIFTVGVSSGKGKYVVGPG